MKGNITIISELRYWCVAWLFSEELLYGIKDSSKLPRNENKAFSKPSFMMLTVSGPVSFLCFIPSCSGKIDVCVGFFFFLLINLIKLQINLKSSDVSIVGGDVIERKS